MNYTLNTGVMLPAIGFGTWQLRSAKAAVLAALKAGYRLIDTAHIYGNEDAVGEAIREAGISRDQLFITTKLWNTDQGYDSAIKACQESLKKLGLDYIDLYLIHWPATKKRFDSWRAMQQLLDDGLIKAAGVSNFTVEHLQEFEQFDLKPAVNQIEFHPFIYEQQHAVINYCRERDILIEAYSPISRLGDVAAAPIDTLTKKYDKAPQQIVLRWCVQQGTLPLPRSTKPEHIQSNFDIFHFELTDDDMHSLNHISDGERVTWDPAGMGR